MKELEKTELIVPKGIKYISDWRDYELPKGHCIVDKGVTGCGYTEFCIRNNKNIILCAPRKLLLINKKDQHKDEKNILYLRNITDSELMKIFTFRKKSLNNQGFDIGGEEYDPGTFRYHYMMGLLDNHINYCMVNDLPAKVLVTYDSSHYVFDYLIKHEMMNQFQVIVDEFQSIFVDSFMKAGVEDKFVSRLQQCKDVIYLSATPMLDSYLRKVPEFSNLKYYVINWSQSGYVEKVKLEKRLVNSLCGECIKIINRYKQRRFPTKYDSYRRKVYLSTEAVFYMNSVTDIKRVITKSGLSPEEVNIICADTESNKKALKECGFTIGKVPLLGQTNKMFTFCTSTTYVGVDFYSTCAKSYIFADPNLKCLAVDISLDLPQIVGRQRLRENPFKNDVVMVYKSLSAKKIQSRSDFEEEQRIRRQNTQDKLDLYKASLTSNKPGSVKAYLKMIETDIKSKKYSEDFISISENNEPVVNTFIELAQERAWEVSQKEYQDLITVTKACFDDIEFDSTEVDKMEECQKLDELLRDFLDAYYDSKVFKERLRMLCDFMDEFGDIPYVSSVLKTEINNSKMFQYYFCLGTKGCRAKKYEEKALEMFFVTQAQLNSIKDKVITSFDIGTKYSNGDIRVILGSIYKSFNIDREAKAKDLGLYFDIERVKTCKDGILDNGYKPIRVK